MDRQCFTHPPPPPPPPPPPHPPPPHPPPPTPHPHPIPTPPHHPCMDKEGRYWFGKLLVANITRTKAYQLSVGLLRINVTEILIKIWRLPFKKCIWKCSLQCGGHLSVSQCDKRPISPERISILDANVQLYSVNLLFVGFVNRICVRCAVHRFVVQLYVLNNVFRLVWLRCRICIVAQLFNQHPVSNILSWLNEITRLLIKFWLTMFIWIIDWWQMCKKYYSFAMINVEWID